jgi:thymidine kinase
MGSAKTLNLLAVAHSYRLQGKRVLILKPALDTRFGEDSVKSRSGLEKPADVLIRGETRLSPKELSGLSCILVDEAQFLEPSFVDHLRDIASSHNIPVICYGLRTDFRTELFPGSKRLLEVSDTIEEVKNTCHYCNKKAVFNARLMNGIIVSEGPQVLLGAEETYLPVCPTCYELHKRPFPSRTQSSAALEN